MKSLALVFVWISLCSAQMADPSADLVAAARDGKLDTLQKLLDAGGADPNKANSSGQTASFLVRDPSPAWPTTSSTATKKTSRFHPHGCARRMAAQQEPIEIHVLRTLLEAGADPNVQDYGDRLSALMKQSDPRAVQPLVEHGAKLNLRNAEGLTALGLACKGLQKRNPSDIAPVADKALYLIGRGADVNIAHRQGYTPLMDAVHTLNKGTVPTMKRCVEALIKAGANLNAQGAHGQTVMW